MENNSSNRFNLENHKKKDLFTVPDQYFEELPSRIQGRINQSKSRRWYEELAYNPLFRNASVALGMVLIVIGIYLFNKPAEQISSTTSSLSDLTNDEVVEYLVGNPYASVQIEELYEGDIINIEYSTEQIIEQSDADEIEEIVTDL
jgi:hypothetical protein